jgi:hypothetical protein
VTTELTVAVPVPTAAPPIAKVEQVPSPARPATLAIKNMLDLLKKPASLPTAFLLREVLDLPVSKRPRRRK